jgi:hypothetical protein
MTYFASTEDFLAQFGDLEALKSKGFFGPIYLDDRKAGFSIKRYYPDNIRYSPAIGQKSLKPDNIAVLWVVYTHPDDFGREVNLSAVPLRIGIAEISFYQIKHGDYDYNDREGDCPSKNSVEESLATPRPRALEYLEDYVFDHSQNEFIDRKGRIVSGVEILDRVFRDHCNTVHLFWGLKLRIKRFIQNEIRGKLVGLLGGLFAILVWALKNLFGRSIESDDRQAGFLEMYKPKALKKYNLDSLSIFGYKASKQVSVLFCFLTISASFIRYQLCITNDYWASVTENAFLSLVHGLFIICLLDVVFPRCLFWMINGVIWLRARLLFMWLTA